VVSIFTFHLEVFIHDIWALSPNIYVANISHWRSEDYTFLVVSAFFQAKEKVYYFTHNQLDQNCVFSTLNQIYYSTLIIEIVLICINRLITFILVCVRFYQLCVILAFKQKEINIFQYKIFVILISNQYILCLQLLKRANVLKNIKFVS
jgi:hypothetical protein